MFLNTFAFYLIKYIVVKNQIEIKSSYLYYKL